MARPSFLIIGTLILAIIGCSNSQCYTKLEEVDSLTEKDLTDSACKVLETIEKTYKIKEGKEKAYYNLLKYQLLFRKQYHEDSYSMNDSIIDYSISYYSKHKEKQKLALCYYLKGRVSKNKEAIKYLKEAEFIIQDTDDDFLKTRILGYIAVINGKNEDYNTALRYCLKAIEYGKKANDIGTLTWWYLNLSSIYGNLNEPDSCTFYANKCIKYIKTASDKQKASIYIHIAAAIENTDTIKAKEFAWRAIKIEPTNNAYQILAKIARENKDYRLSEIYLNEALKYCKSVDWEAFVLYELAETMELMGRHKEANRLSTQVIKLRDSVEYIWAQDSIKETQAAAEMENKSRNEIEEKDDETQQTTIALTLVIVAIAAAYGIKRHRHKKQIEKYRRDIEKIEKENKKIEEDNKNKKKEIAAVNRKMLRQQEKMKAEAIKQQKEMADMNKLGFNIYNKVKNGESGTDWNKTNLKSFILFYQSIAPDFKKNADRKYTKLTDYQYTLLIMKDMGMNNRQIANALGITESAVRAQASRIKRTSAEEATEEEEM